jgi:diphthamide synthase (EF-2-diphthine--ammonia ligase)
VTPELAAVQLAAAVLPTLIEEIASALAEGLDERAAVARALERMRATALPAAVSGEIASHFAAARERLARELAEKLPAHDVAALRRIAARGDLGHEERAAMGALLSIVTAQPAAG